MGRHIASHAALAGACGPFVARLEEGQSDERSRGLIGRHSRPELLPIGSQEPEHRSTAIAPFAESRRRNVYPDIRDRLRNASTREQYNSGEDNDTAPQTRSNQSR